jgi:hypothetical protein
VRQQYLLAIVTIAEVEAEASAMLSVFIHPVEEAAPPPPPLHLTVTLMKRQESNKRFTRQSLLELLKQSVLGMSPVVGLAIRESES